MRVDELVWRNADTLMDDKQVHQVEAELGIRFPDDFFQAIKKYHGGSPAIRNFDYRDEQGREAKAGFGGFVSFDPNSEENILAMNNPVPEGLSDGLVIFGRDGGSGYFCFDYRKNPDSPTVAYWVSSYHSPDIEFPLADTFTEFVNMLYDPHLNLD